jgi:uncharacterized protein with ATP-grasp and redox domains
MKTYLDCLPCLISQALRAARAATDNEEIQRQVINAVAGMIPEFSLGLKPPEIAQQGYRLIRQITGNNDPFHQAKVEANHTALALWPQMKQLVEQSADQLFTACRLAILANSIDFGPNFEHGGIEAVIEEAATCSIPLSVNDYDQFWNSINSSRSLLYLGDNAGEIVFDRLLIEEIHRVRELETCFVVREKPVINDITVDDALAVGMNRVARIVSSFTTRLTSSLPRDREIMNLWKMSQVIFSSC